MDFTLSNARQSYLSNGDLLGLQSKQVKRSCHEWINKFIMIANLISVIISIICSSDE